MGRRLAPGSHQGGKAGEVVVGVMGAWAGFGVVLDAEDGLVAEGQGRHCLVVEIAMADRHPLGGQGVGVDGEAVVLAGDLHIAVAAAGVVEAAVAVAELEGGSPQGEPKNLVAQADPKDRQLGLEQQRLGQCDAAGYGGWITRTVGEKDAFRFKGQNLRQAGA